MEAAALANGEIVKHPIGSLRAIAQTRLLRACDADGCADADKIADRLDGKVPQAIVGDDEYPGVVNWKEWTEWMFHPSLRDATTRARNSSPTTAEQNDSAKSSPTDEPAKP